jgi:hypothetical protein
VRLRRGRADLPEPVPGRAGSGPGQGRGVGGHGRGGAPGRGLACPGTGRVGGDGPSAVAFAMDAFTTISAFTDLGEQQPVSARSWTEATGLPNLPWRGPARRRR